VAGAIVSVMVIGFVTGALARLAVPGPDPMPLWLTTAIGLAGSLVGGGIAYAIFGRSATAASTGGFIAAVLLVVAYRRFVQKRPLTGPGALRFPERGFGIERQRERLQQLGLPLDPAASVAGRAVSPATDAETDDLLVKLNDLHRAGVLTDDEYRAKRELVHERQETP
jgi:uncharacterized membrane protein YeaQ/YmgE (transglycosylase-associated protein family)